MLPLLLLLACSDPPAPRADQIPYGDGTVADALDRALAQGGSAEEGEDERDPPGFSPERLAQLEERIGRLELVITQIQQTGTTTATAVGFDPRATTLSSTNVQTALDELEARVSKMESKVGQEMGQAGPGMFAVPNGRSGGPGGGGGGGMQGGGGGGMQGGGGGGGGMQGGGGGGGGMQGGGR